jgi:hypothetical protein
MMPRRHDWPAWGRSTRSWGEATDRDDLRYTADGVEVLDTISGRNEFGDATVPLPGAIGHGLSTGTNRIHRVADSHGDLQLNRAAWDQIESIITASDVVYMAEPPVVAGYPPPELVTLGEQIPVTVDIEQHSDGPVPAVRVASPERGSQRPDVRTPRTRDQRLETTFAPTDPGAYRLDVAGVAAGAVSPVTATVVVFPRDPG